MGDCCWKDSKVTLEKKIQVIGEGEKVIDEIRSERSERWAAGGIGGKNTIHCFHPGRRLPLAFGVWVSLRAYWDEQRALKAAADAGANVNVIVIESG